MISQFAAARHTALGGGVCHLVSAATRKGATTSGYLQNASGASSDLVYPVALASTTPEAETRPSTDLGSLRTKVHQASVYDDKDAVSEPSCALTVTTWPTRLRSRPLSTPGALAGLAAWRLPAAAASASGPPVWPQSASSALRGSLMRCLHASAATSGAAAVSAAAAAAAAAAAERQAATGAAAAAAAAAAGRPPVSRRQQPLSPHAYEFQRRFFQLVNSGTAAAVAASSDDAAAAEAVAHTTNSQAIRMLLAWLEEGRLTAVAEHKQERASAAAEGVVAAEAAPAPSLAPGAVAAPYRLDQQVIDRAMEVLWRLYHREGVIVARSREANDAAGGSATPVSTTANGPMGLSELLNAVEVLAAAAPAMGLTFKRQHYELLIELYGKRALQEPSSRRGLAQRLLAVRQQMVQQLMPLSQMSLHTILQAVRTDPLVNNPSKLAWALRLVERDLPVVPLPAGGASTSASSAAPSAGRRAPSAALRPETTAAAAGGGGIAAPLQQTLNYLLRMAAREADWSAYAKLEAALVSRTRATPPYEVLLDALHAASAAGGSGSRLALGFLAQMEQIEAKGQQLGPRQQHNQQRQQRDVPASQGLSQQAQEQASEEQLQARQQQQERQLRQQRWQEQEAERRLDQELRSLRQLVHVGVEQGDEQLARKVYDRMRRLFWREHPAVAAAAAAAEKAKAKAAAAADAAKAAKEADGAAAVANESEDAEESDDEDDDDVAAASGPAEAYGHAAVLEVAETCPAPPDATLELLSLSLSRRDWSGVMDHVASLAQLQSLVRRSRGRVGRLLLGDASRMESLTSAYGGLGPVSEALILREEDTVAYYTELLQRVGAAAASGAAAPFGGSSLPYGPPLRAAAARADLASVSAIVRQMRELHCAPGADSYAAVVEASLRAGKPDRVPGLIELMVEEELVPTAPLWEVQLRVATQSGDLAALQAVAERALTLADEQRRARRGLAQINPEVLAAAAAMAEARADSRAASAVKLLRLRAEELRNQHSGERERRRPRWAVAEAAPQGERPAAAAAAAAAAARGPQRRYQRRFGEGDALRRDAVSLL